MSCNFKDKVALITGASSKFGSTIAKKLAHEGAHVILISRHIDNLKQIDNDIKESQGSATLVQLDLLDFNAIKECSTLINSKFGVLDILIAGAEIIGDSQPLYEYSLETWNKIIDTNFSSSWYLIKNFNFLLKYSKAGRVIFLISEVIESIVSCPYWGAYAASKTALEAIVKIYSTETKHTGICINMVYPGSINSVIKKKTLTDSDATESIISDKLRDRFLYLISEECKYSGKTYQLDLPID
ncbi:SDR family oxidoreductase [Wolbachia endosymbiont of Pentidionis agamae]|uniref:SDR family oxidoreductase n=1 Tax=Wolbachia endosymbiont of Pentidionis agamae TaxID=3110435 RepID=UPI002FCF6B61